MIRILLIVMVAHIWADHHPSPYSAEHDVLYPKVQGSELVTKGEYLVKAGDCIACHSKPDGKPFAGGLPIHSPFGTFYPPNITSDKKYGIGQWSDADMIGALKHGHAPDGSLYYPALPYPYYAKISDDDVKAIRAYLLATPAVSKPSQPHDIPFPFNIRWLVHFWNMLYFYPFQGEYTYQPQQSVQVNRGAFLVEGLAHCGMCHTPRNMIGGPIESKRYTGGEIDGWLAPNITGTSLKNVTENDLVTLFLYDDRPGERGKIQGPMRQVNHDSLEYLTQKDLFAISAYIKTTVDAHPMELSLTTDRRGEQVYQAKCAACHNIGSAGAPKLSDRTAWAQRFQTPMEVLTQRVINGYNAMPARGLCTSEKDEGCSDADMIAAIDYIKVKTAGGMMKPATVTKKKWGVADGQKRFELSCQQCHDNPSSKAPQIGREKDWSGVNDFDMLLKGLIKGPDADQQAHCALPKGGCQKCSTAELIQTLKYILNKTVPGKNYDLW